MASPHPVTLLVFLAAPQGCLLMLMDPPSWQGLTSLRRDASAAPQAQCTGQRQGGQPPGASVTQCTRVGEVGSACEDTFVAPSGAADVVWVVDTSGSMTNEVAGIQNNVNAFANIISGSGLDYHIVFVGDQGAGSYSGNTVCVPPPLAGPSCGASSRFKPVNQYVDSNDGPAVLLQTLPGFASFLRPGSHKAIVFVTDDDSDLDATNFLSQLAGTSLAGATVHGVVAQDLTQCPEGAAAGNVYMDLIQRTGGLYVPICCDHYDDLAHTLAQDVVNSTGRYPLSYPAMPDTVRVYVVNAAGVRDSVTQGVTYDAASQAVVLDVASRPASGAQVVIGYTTP